MIRAITELLAVNPYRNSLGSLDTVDRQRSIGPVAERGHGHVDVG